MPRRKRVLKRPAISPDKDFNDILVTRLVNRVMLSGKKTVANKIVYKALMEASKELQVEPLEVLRIALNNIRPQIEVKSMRVGGANYQVPVEPYPERAVSLSLRWLVKAAKEVKGKPMWIKLKDVLIQSFNGEGAAVTKRNTVHQTAAGNKAFAHLAVWAKRRKEGK
jgi:small subunit ribosomal protein S7